MNLDEEPVQIDRFALLEGIPDKNQFGKKELEQIMNKFINENKSEK